MDSLVHNIGHHYGNKTDLKPFEYSIISSILISMAIMSFSGLHLFLG